MSVPEKNRCREKGGDLDAIGKYWERRKDLFTH